MASVESAAVRVADNSKLSRASICTCTIGNHIQYAGNLNEQNMWQRAHRLSGFLIVYIH